MREFHVGDRVCCLVNTPSYQTEIHEGDVGTVVDIGIGGGIGVRWDEEFGGHNCKGHCDSGYGWYVRRAEIQPYFDTPDNAIATADDIIAFLGVSVH